MQSSSGETCKGSTLWLFELGVALNERVGRTVVRKLRLADALEFGNNLVRQRFAEFYTPLIERVDVPDRALHEDLVLVQRDNFTQRFRRQAFREDSVGRTVTFSYAEWDLEGRAAFCRDLLGCFSEGQRLRLRDHVGNQEVVVRLECVHSLVEPDEVTVG